MLLAGNSVLSRNYFFHTSCG